MVANDVKQSLVNLIELGDRWLATKTERHLNINTLSEKDGYTTVPGCMAAVKMRISTAQSVISDVTGTADSRVALGMLAYLSMELQGKEIASVLKLDPQQFCRDLGVSDLLPPGRLNGFQNMLRTVQQMLQPQRPPQQLDRPASATTEPEQPAPPSSSVFINEPTAVRAAPATSTAATGPRHDEVAVLLSGGVDSSLALKLLKDQGVPVRAYYLKIWLEDEVAHLNECPWEEDLSYAQQVCAQLGVPLETLSLQKEYWQHVVQYTLHEVRQGRTPNPDIMCNSRIKFGMFYEYVHQRHSLIATGHYARLESYAQSSIFGRLDHSQLSADDLDQYVIMRRSPDPVKDQSYFLSNLRQDQLQRCRFPIGAFEKETVRALARENSLPTMLRKDSQGICFLGKLSFNDFLGHYMGKSPGDIRHYVTGDLVGRHEGLWFHTVHQRKGLGPLLNNDNHHAGPWFVVSKDMEQNVLYVTNDMRFVDTPRRLFHVPEVRWQVAPPVGLAEGVTLDVRLRHSPQVAAGRVTLASPNGCPSDVRVELVELDRGIAPGQFATFYLGDYCLGAGMIASTVDDIHSYHSRMKATRTASVPRSTSRPKATSPKVHGAALPRSIEI
eukprot:gene3842-2726_t